MVSRRNGESVEAYQERKNSYYRERYVPVAPEARKPRGPRGGTHSPESRAAMRAAWARRNAAGLSGPRLGIKHTTETRAKISAATRERTPRGPACHSYKDGKLAERRDARFSQEAKRWRFDVMSRDNFTCQQCGDDRGGNLVAHHIKGWADYPALRYEIANGLTLCTTCHHEVHSHG